MSHLHVHCPTLARRSRPLPDPRNWLRLVALAAAAACGDSGSPPEPVELKDPVALAAALGPIGAAFASAPLQSLGGLALPLYFSGVEIFSISPAQLGKTLEWDIATQRFAETARTGAPATALRVVLYALDSAAGTPAVPLVEAGTVDLYPRSVSVGDPGDTTSLRFVVSGAGASPVILADFTAWSVFTPSCLCATLTGYVTAGATRVDFTAPYNIIFQGTATFTATLDASPGSTHLLHDGILPPAGDSTFAVDLRLSFLGDSLHTSGSLALRSSGPESATVSTTVNGRDFATVSYSGGVETFTTPDGHGLVAAEQEAIRALARAALALALNVEFPTLVVFFCGC